MTEVFHATRYTYPPLRVVLHKEPAGDDQKWVAVALEYFIAGQGDTLLDALHALHQMLAARVVVAREHKLGDPFANVPSAPDDLWDDFENGVLIMLYTPLWYPTPTVRIGKSA